MSSTMSALIAVSTVKMIFHTYPSSDRILWWHTGSNSNDLMQVMQQDKVQGYSV